VTAMIVSVFYAGLSLNAPERKIMETLDWVGCRRKRAKAAALLIFRWNAFVHGRGSRGKYRQAMVIWKKAKRKLAEARLVLDTPEAPEDLFPHLQEMHNDIHEFMGLRDHLSISTRKAKSRRNGTTKISSPSVRSPRSGSATPASFLQHDLWQHAPTSQHAPDLQLSVAQLSGDLEELRQRIETISVMLSQLTSLTRTNHDLLSTAPKPPQPSVKVNIDEATLRKVVQEVIAQQTHFSPLPSRSDSPSNQASSSPRLQTDSTEMQNVGPYMLLPQPPGLPEIAVAQGPSAELMWAYVKDVSRPPSHLVPPPQTHVTAATHHHSRHITTHPTRSSLQPRSTRSNVPRRHR